MVVPVAEIVPPLRASAFASMEMPAACDSSSASTGYVKTSVFVLVAVPDDHPANRSPDVSGPPN